MSGPHPKTTISRGSAGLIACTIIARNYLSHARILARSYREHHPGAEFFLLCVDGVPDGSDPGDGVHLVDPADLDCPYFRELCFKYEVVELCTAIKPTLLRHLFQRTGASSVLYLDPDILVMRPLAELPAALDGASLVLTPQLLHPLPLDGQKPDELDVLSCGTFNLGFLALARCAESFAFLDWWEERLRDGCLYDHGRRHFVDQKWVDFAPCFFPSTAILRDDAYNVALWNIPSRRIDRDGDTFLVNGRPIAFFHFSGFRAEHGDFGFESTSRVTMEEGSPLVDLLKLYNRLQEENGNAVCRRWPYGYSRFSNGAPIGRVFRRLYLGLDGAERARFPDPFSIGGAESFFEWALTPDPRRGDLSPFLLSLYQLRPDVIATYPDVFGAHRDAFIRWAKTSGAQEMEFEPRMVRTTGASPTLEESPGDPLEITAVIPSPLDREDLVAVWFDLPKKGQSVDAGSLVVAGWVLGRRGPVEGVEIVQAGQVVARADVDGGRPEIAAANPNILYAARCGFRTTVAVEARSDSELIVEAVLPDERRVAIGLIRARPRQEAAP